MRRQAAAVLALRCALLASAAAQPAPATVDLLRGFAAPPAEARAMMRWWWFGPAVENGELSRELHVMQQAGLGGVEIQPVYPLALDDPAHGIKNLPYLSPEFLAAVHFSDATAHSLGLRVDITLGSGWPYGGPGTTLALSAARLKLVTLPARQVTRPLPAPAAGDTLLAAFVASGVPQHWSAQDAVRVEVPAGATALNLPSVSSDPHTLLLFYASHTRQQVKRPAAGAEGLVLDHFSRAAIDEHLHDVADPLAQAFGSERPYSVFSDSLEVYGADWTPELPQEFERRRGYDLIAHLPELYAGGSPQASAVRHDWGQTLSELICENYLQPITAWSREHGTLFRSQTYGEPAVTLADEAVPNLPEGEGPQWRQFSFTRWATSASHLYDRPVTSAETFTWLHSPVFRATPLDMKVEVDRMFLSGVNQIIGHGWPYTPAGVPEPGWNLYAAAVFNDHNPWFAVMPEIARYMQRGSWLLRQGKPANDVAVLLPEEDGQAAFSPGHVSVTDEMRRLITPELMRAILDAGYNLDFVDAASLHTLGKVPYPIVVLPPTERMALDTARLLATFAAGGGSVIATGTLPTLAPGLQSERDSAAVAATIETLFASGNPHAVALSSARELPEALHRALPPDLASSTLPDPAQASGDSNAGLGFIHRKLAAEDVYFVVNSSNRPLTTTLSFRARRASIARLSMDSGEVVQAQSGSVPVQVAFAPYESAVFLLSDGAPARTPAGSSLGKAAAAESSPDLDRSAWTLAFAQGAAQPLSSFAAWNTLPDRKFFSGEGVYRTTFQMAKPPSAGNRVVLDFGQGEATTDTRRPGSAGISALLEPPVREAAIVLVNGQRAGSVWHPPYRVDLTGFVHPGANTVEVRVYNTAVNELAGQPPRDYTALNARYGKRFDPQDMDQIQSLPSGLLRAPTLHLEQELP